MIKEKIIDLNHYNSFADFIVSLWHHFDTMSIPDSESTGCFGPKKKKDAKGSQKGKPDVAYQK